MSNATKMHSTYQTEAEWLAEVAAVKGRRAAVVARDAAFWAHMNTLIALAATEDAAR